MKKVLIANRGEICLRIAQSCRYLGLKTVVLGRVPFEDQKLAPWVDEIVSWEGLLETRKVYSDPETWLKAAQQAQVWGIHPGVGFLAEDSHFAHLVEKNGFVWIGPKPETIELMARKDQALSFVEKLGLSLQKHWKGPLSETESLKEWLAAASYPLLVKSAPGGGGRAMRSISSFSEAFSLCQEAAEEGKRLYGPQGDYLVIEEKQSQKRHIEVQILGDGQGGLWTLGIRDGSWQRRCQKVLEETPPNPVLKEEELYNFARILGKALHYRSLGTVEFLVDEEGFFFLEMNTRLQVEHTVTEEVWGVDLVEWQLKIALGEKLPEAPPYVPRGHSVEVRLYGEDPQRNFWPAPGKILSFIPGRGLGIRWDENVTSGTEISQEFDPLLGKLIAWGENRHQAYERLYQALKDTFVVGIPTNRSFLLDLVQEQCQAPKTYTVGEVETREPVRLRSWNESLQKKLQEAQPLLEACQSYNHGPFATGPNQTMILRQDNVHGLFWGIWKNGFFRALQKENGWHVLWDGWDLLTPSSFQEISSTKISSREKPSWQSPITGVIRECLIVEGQEVKKGELCFILESMKMEFLIHAPETTLIKKVWAKKGDSFSMGKNLAESQRQP